MSVVSGIMSANAAGDAADASSDAAIYASQNILTGIRESNALTERMYQQGRTDQAPWREAGAEAENALWKKVQAGPGEFTESPGYQFRLDEGEKAVTRSAAAKGSVLGGATLKALSRYNQDFASNEYSNFLNQYYASLQPYQNLSTLGQASAAGTAATGMQSASTQANTTTQGNAQAAQAMVASGNAQAAGYINQSNAWTGAINSGVNNYLNWKYLTSGSGGSAAGGVGGTVSQQGVGEALMLS